MKLDLTKQLFDLEGKPATQTTVTGYNKDGSPKEVIEVPLTLALVLKTALNFVPKENGPEVDVLVKRGHWIISITKNECPDFKVEDLTEIKQQCKLAGFNPIVLAQVDALIEGK
jgi:hypothetical protein